MRKITFLLILIFISLSFVACSVSPEPAAPTEPAAVEDGSPTDGEADHEHDTPAEVETNFVTSLDQIVGTWIAVADLGNFIVVIDEDSRFYVATSSEDLEKGSTDSWLLDFHGDGHIHTSGYALCIGDDGTYLAVLNPDGTLKFTTVSDSCTNRIRRMDRSLPGRLTPYNLLYHPVK